MRIITCVLLCMLSLTSAIAQTCIHQDIGRQLTIETHRKTVDTDSSIVKVTITNKTAMTSQEIVLTSRLLRSTDWCHCRDVRSYTTGKNAKKEVVDNDFGDLIVADFNFDGLEDVAFKADGGGNGGPTYIFYRQDQKGHFRLDFFLTDSVSFFPVRFDRTKKTLTTVVHQSATYDSETTYQFDPKTNKWRRIRFRSIRA